jgi:segregation and condensation protein B
MEISNLIPHIEALIFASDKPLTSTEITDLVNSAFGFMEDKVGAEQIDAALEGIVEKYNSEFYPFDVRQSGGGWQFLTKKEFHKTVAQLNGEKFLKRLSAAAIETLAIIAYKQPITKGEIETIRGVSTDYTIQKLLEKELIIISGRNEKMPGHPLVYNTSKSFMDYFGINSPEDLPKIREVLAEQLVSPTVINHTDFEESSTMIVTDDGELVEGITDDLMVDTEATNEPADSSGHKEATDAEVDPIEEFEEPAITPEAEELNEWEQEISDEEHINEAAEDTSATDASDRKRDEHNHIEDETDDTNESAS